jgi:predicted nucleic acid-binding protein
MILIDTGPLVALCDQRDSLNSTALKHLKSLAKSQLAICEPVLGEACFHLSTPSQRSRLQLTIQSLEILSVPVDDTRSLWAEVFDWLHKYADHEPDWADGYLAVLCGRDPKWKVWTYDREFRAVWRRPNGSAIPMAVPLAALYFPA